MLAARLSRVTDCCHLIGLFATTRPVTGFRKHDESAG